MLKIIRQIINSQLIRISLIVSLIIVSIIFAFGETPEVKQRINKQQEQITKQKELIDLLQNKIDTIESDIRLQSDSMISKDEIHDNRLRKLERVNYKIIREVK